MSHKKEIYTNTLSTRSSALPALGLQQGIRDEHLAPYSLSYGMTTRFGG